MSTTDNDFEALTDENLIAHARQGSRDALSELLGRHRGRAFAWAKQLAPDPHLAEDIVQEALLRAFLKLGSVTDLSRFLPWLRKIVRNQALMKLRRGGPYAHERPFTSMASSLTGHSEGNGPNWRDLDTVLHHYAKRSGASDRSENSDQRDSSLANWLPSVVQALGKRERDVFEKHFYEQLTPQEIAEQLDTNVNAIHKALSRIRRKADDSRIELDIRSRIRMHADMRGSKKVLLAKPGMQELPPFHPGAAYPNAIYHAMRSLGKQVTTAEVMGFSGYAFNLNVIRTSIGAESPMLFDWDTFIAEGLLNLGYRSRYVDYQHYKNAAASPHKTRNLLFALDMIKDSIDRGAPVLLSSAISYDLALVYGYDDERQLLYASDPNACETIPYSSLYLGTPRIDKAISRELYAFVIDDELEDRYLRRDRRIIRLLQDVVSHAEGGDCTFGASLGGLQAYEEWIAAFENGTVDALGNASNLQLYGRCREQAALFWREQSQAFENDGGWPYIGQLRRLEHLYAAIGCSFSRLRELFPFPHGGTPHEAACRAQAIGFLEQAKHDETSAIDVMRRLLLAYETNDERTNVTPIFHVSLSPFYSFGGIRPKSAPPPMLAAALEAVILTCADLKASMLFYGSLFGIEVPSELTVGPIGLFRLNDERLLVLMDRRLDLNHADWQPAFYVRVPDVDQAYAEAGRQGWRIVNFLDKGGMFTDYFIAADADGHQIMVGSHPLCTSYPVAGCIPEEHPVTFASEEPCTLAVKDPLSSLQFYARLFGPEMTNNSLRLLDRMRTESSVKLRFAAQDSDKAYRMLRHARIAVSGVSDEGKDYGSVSDWLIHDPDGNAIRIRCANA